jgi:ribonuclease-3 family protein
MKENELITMSVASLAYLGDSVFELTVREHLAKSGLTSSAKLNKAALQFVTATAQSAGALRMLDYLSEEELSFYKRGRNHKTSHCPKSADPEEYQRATGLEVLFAFLYLQKKQDRISELFNIGFLNK